MIKDVDVVSLNKLAWDRVAERFNKANYGKIGKVFKSFCDSLPDRGSILDVGCGTGKPFAALLAERNFEVVGIDVSSRMVEIARRNVPLGKFRELSMTNLDYRDEFDGVVSSFSMLLLSPPLFRDVATRIVRSLRRGGFFYLALNEPLDNSVDVDEEALVEIMGEKMYSRAYTQKEVEDVFEPLGLRQLDFHREIRRSKEFGEEHVIEFLFKRT